METGLEVIRNKIMEDSTIWEDKGYKYTEFGDVKSYWYCAKQDLTCIMYYDKDMNGELYLTMIRFGNGYEVEE